MEQEKINFTYKFIFKDGKTREYSINLDATTLDLIEETSGPQPAWTDLEHCKCVHCPLTKDKFPKCPIAKNLAVMADEYKSYKSFEVVTVQVTTKTRNYSKELSLQEGLYSLFGLIMPTTQCPHMNFLRPMARFHLPFSSFHETMVRSASLYLLGQYFEARRGRAPDFELKKMDELYERVQKVNHGIIARIRSIATGDADANSVTILNGFAQLLAMQISDGFSEIEPFFPKA